MSLVDLLHKADNVGINDYSTYARIHVCLNTNFFSPDITRLPRASNEWSDMFFWQIKSDMQKPRVSIGRQPSGSTYPFISSLWQYFSIVGIYMAKHPLLPLSSYRCFHSHWRDKSERASGVSLFRARVLQKLLLIVLHNNEDRIYFLVYSILCHISYPRGIQCRLCWKIKDMCRWECSHCKND